MFDRLAFLSDFPGHPHFDRRLRGHDWRQFQDRHEPLALVVFALPVMPAVEPLGFWMAPEIKNLHDAFPDRLAVKGFRHRHGFNPCRLAGVQVQNHALQPLDVFFIRHSVQPIPQRSTGSFRFQPPSPGCIESPSAICRSYSTRNLGRPQPQSFPAFC